MLADIADQPFQQLCTMLQQGTQRGVHVDVSEPERSEPGTQSAVLSSKRSRNAELADCWRRVRRKCMGASRQRLLHDKQVQADDE